MPIGMNSPTPETDYWEDFQAAEKRAEALEEAMLEMIGDLMMLRSVMNRELATIKASSAALAFDVND